MAPLAHTRHTTFPFLREHTVDTRGTQPGRLSPGIYHGCRTYATHTLVLIERKGRKGHERQERISQCVARFRGERTEGNRTARGARSTPLRTLALLRLPRCTAATRCRCLRQTRLYETCRRALDRDRYVPFPRALQIKL